MNIGFIGCGNMGGALARAVARVSYARIYLYDKDTDKALALAGEIDGKAVELSEVAGCDYIFLGVKPNIVKGVLSEIKVLLGEDTVLISMCAGVKLESLTEALGKNQPIIRIMPNTPVAYGEGMILYTATPEVGEIRLAKFLDFMKYSGTLDEIPESLIDAGSALSGCGPAFVYMFIEALADSVVRCGMPSVRLP